MSDETLKAEFRQKLPFLCSESDSFKFNTALLGRTMHFITLLALARIKEYGNSSTDLSRFIDKEMGKFPLRRNVVFQELLFKDRLLPLDELFGKNGGTVSQIMLLLEGYRSLLLRLSHYGSEELIDNTAVMSDYINYVADNFSATLRIANGEGFSAISSGSILNQERGSVYHFGEEGEGPLCLHPLIIMKKSGLLLFFEGVDLDGIRYNSVEGPSVENNQQLLKSFCSFFIQSGAYRSALFVSKKLINEYEDDYYQEYCACCHRGFQHFIHGRYHLSAKHFERAFDIDNTVPVLYYNLAQCYRKLKAQNRYTSILRKLVRTHPEQARGFELLGDLFLEKQEREKALKLFGKVLSLNPVNTVVERKLKNAGRTAKPLPDSEKGQPVGKEQKKTEIMNFLVDLTKEARKGKIQQITGRESELVQLEEILSCRNKRNAIVLGEAGVGKTSLVEELANRIVCGKVPDLLRGITIYKMSVASLLAGAKFRGQFEERIVNLVDELKNERAILFIDDIHTIIGSGLSKGGSMDASSIIKPSLLNGELQVVGTSGYDAYRLKVEKEPSLERCFQIVKLEEPNLEETEEIIMNFKSGFEEFHGIVMSEKVIKETLPVIKVCIKERAMPDKALDVYDRAAVKASHRMEKEGNKDPDVRIEEVYQAISDLSGVPVEKVAGMKSRKLRNLESSFKKRIIGQDEAIETVSRAMRTGRLNLGVNEARPDGIFLFIGPTGVGKTELARAMAEELFGNEKSLIRIDMSEYMEKISSSRLIGTSPGYIGYNDQNQLTDLVRKNPYSVVLLDEIEKADSQMINLFLQVFDAGRLTDGRGRSVSFSNTTFVMTSNLGTELYSQYKMGYSDNVSGYRKVSHRDLMKQLKKYFPPEFLNRLDEIVFFSPLDKNALRSIAKLRFSELEKRMDLSFMKLDIDESVYDYIADISCNVEYGARNIERTIRRTVLDGIAEKMLFHNVDKGVIVELSVNKGELEINFVTDSETGAILEVQENDSEKEEEE